MRSPDSTIDKTKSISEESSIPIAQHLPQLNASSIAADPEGDNPSGNQPLKPVKDKPAVPEGGADTSTTSKDDAIATRSGRISKPPARFDDYVSIESVFSDELDCCKIDDHPVVYAASTDPDVLLYHEAMMRPDRVQFIRAMVKEIQAHMDGKN
jgi:hypothetical protein